MNYIIAYLASLARVDLLYPLMQSFYCHPRWSHRAFLFVHTAIGTTDLSSNLRQSYHEISPSFISRNRFPRTIVGIGRVRIPIPYMYKWSPYVVELINTKQMQASNQIHSTPASYTILTGVVQVIGSHIWWRANSQRTPFRPNIGTIERIDDGMVGVGVQTAAAIVILDGHLTLLILVIGEADLDTLLVKALVLTI